MTDYHKFDKLDVKLLNELQENARISVSDLSRKLKIPHTTLYLRIKALERRGVIKDYRAQLDYEKVGKPLMAITEVAVEPAYSTKELIDRMLKIKNLVWMYSVTGDADLILFTIGVDMHEVNETIMEIRHTKGVLKTSTITVLDALKEPGTIQL